MRSILRRLIECKAAHIPRQEIDGIVADMVEITDYGAALVKGA